MKRKIQIIFCLILATAVLLPFSAGCGLPVGKETAQKAIVETALAYYRRNPNMQYDARSLTIESGQYGPGRLTQNASPEYADFDQTHFSQCTEFVLDILYNTFGWTFFDGVKMPHTDPGLQWDSYEGKALVYKNAGITDANLTAELDKYVKMLEPGDIIISFAEESGHALMYLGDCLGDGKKYIIHCWGGSVDYDGMVHPDKYEKNGSIYLQTIEDVLLGKNSGGPNWDLHTHVQGYLALFRFSEDPKFKTVLTPAAKSRITYPGLTVTRRAEGLSQYSDLPEGETVTVSVTVRNDGAEDITGLKIKEALPKTGLSLLDGEETEWTVDLKKGASVTKSYRATVTGKRGETVTIPSGAVDRIQTRELEFKVGGKQFTTEQKEALLLSAEMVPRVQGEELDGVKDYYRQVLGLDLPLPDTTEELFRALFEKALSATGDPMIQVRATDDTNRTYFEMIPREHISGHYVKQGDDGTNRQMEIKEVFYQPGDLVLSMQSVNRTSVATLSAVHYYIYLGQGLVLHYNKGAFELVAFENSIQNLLHSNSLVTLRPTLAIDDVTQEKVPVRIEEDRIAKDFASFKDLCGTGAVAVEGKVALEESLSLGGQRLILKDGAELDLADFDLTKVSKIQLGEGAVLTSSGAGRIQMELSSQTQTKEALAAYAGLPVGVKLGFTSSKLSVDCLEKLIVFNEELSAGGDALRLAADIILPGWTLRMDKWYGSNFELPFPSGVIIDVHGQWLSLNGFGDGDLKIIDTVGGGYFGWRGATDGKKITVKNNIDAEGATLQVGYKSVTKGDECFANCFFTGSVTCKELRLLFGSKAEAAQGGTLTELK